MVRLTLTPLQAECLLQLAQEADFATFECDDDAVLRMRAGDSAIDKLIRAIDAAGRKGAASGTKSARP